MSERSRIRWNVGILGFYLRFRVPTCYRRNGSMRFSNIDKRRVGNSSGIIFARKIFIARIKSRDANFSIFLYHRARGLNLEPLYSRFSVRTLARSARVYLGDEPIRIFSQSHIDFFDLTRNRLLLHRLLLYYWFAISIQNPEKARALTFVGPHAEENSGKFIGLSCRKTCAVKPWSSELLSSLFMIELKGWVYNSVCS